MATYLEHKIRGNVQTTNATPTTIAEYTIPADETSVMVEVWIMGRQAGSTNSASYFGRAVYAKESGSSGQMYNSVTELQDAGANMSASIGLNIDIISPQVTGAAATTINWVCFMTVMVFTP